MDSVNSDLKKFSHCIGQNWYHIVLIPKARFPLFHWPNKKHSADLAFEWICKRHNINLYAKEIMPDHVHLFVSCPPDYSIRRFIQVLKGGSSYYIRKRHPAIQKYKHLWSRGAMYRSIGSVSADKVKDYIEKSNNWSKTKQTKL